MDSEKGAGRKAYDPCIMLGPQVMTRKGDEPTKESHEHEHEHEHSSAVATEEFQNQQADPYTTGQVNEHVARFLWLL